MDKDDALGYKGKRVLVSGAATGMGAATTKILLDLGAEVFAADIKPVEQPIKKFIQVDLRDKVSIDHLVAELPASVDAIFSCAGLPGAPFSDVDVMLVNFVGARHLIESLVPKMPKGSAVATIASSGGIGWQQKLATWMELFRAESFEAGKAWCEAHPEVIAGGYAPRSRQ